MSTSQTPAPKPRTSRSSSIKDNQTKSRGSSKCSSPTKTKEKKLPPIKAPVGLAKGPDLKNVKSRVDSLRNLKHTPAGGDKKVLTQKLEWKAASKIGSLKNINHKPGGGTIKIFNEKISGRSSSEVRQPIRNKSPTMIKSNDKQTTSANKIPVNENKKNVDKEVEINKTLDQKKNSVDHTFKESKDLISGINKLSIDTIVQKNTNPVKE